VLIKEQLIFHISEGASHFAQRTHRALILDVLVVLLVNIKGDERPAVALETGLLVNWALPLENVSGARICDLFVKNCAGESADGDEELRVTALADEGRAREEVLVGAELAG